MTVVAGVRAGHGMLPLLADRDGRARPVGVIPLRRGVRAEAAAWIATWTLPSPVLARLRGR